MRQTRKREYSGTDNQGVPAVPQDLLKYGDFELDLGRYELRRAGHILKLERIPMDLLILLAERQGQLVSREEIIEKLWGKEVFVDTVHGINTAIRKIRQVLRDDPESPRFVETVVGKGYRFIAPISEDGGKTSLGVWQWRSKAILSGPRTLTLGALAVFLAMLATAYATYRYFRVPPAAPAQRVMLAVLPFSNFSGNPAQDYFSDGMTEEVITRLGQFNPERLGVIGRTTSMQYKESHKTLGEIGRELHVDYVIEGGLQREAQRVRITVQLILVSDQTHLWAQTYDRNLGDVLALESDVALDIANEIRIKLSSAQQTRSLETRSIDPEAYEEALKGRYYLRRWLVEDDAVEKARQHLERSIAKDPNYSRAYSGLADAYFIRAFGLGRPRDVMPKAEALALKALQLDGQSAEAHNTLAAIKLRYYWNWAGAEREVKRALELDPSYPEAYSTYADYFWSLGRREEALAQNRQASAVDPLYTEMNLYVGYALLGLHRYDEALAEFRKMLELDPNSVNAHWSMGNAYGKKGMFKESIEEWRRAYTLDGNTELAGVLGACDSDSCYQEALKAVARKRLEKYERSTAKGIYVDPVAYVEPFVQLGDKDHAFAWLEKAYEERSSGLALLKDFEVADYLKSDPRFADLVQRIGIP